MRRGAARLCSGYIYICMLGMARVAGYAQVAVSVPRSGLAVPPCSFLGVSGWFEGWRAAQPLHSITFVVKCASRPLLPACRLWASWVSVQRRCSTYVRAVPARAGRRPLSRSDTQLRDGEGVWAERGPSALRGAPLFARRRAECKTALA
jgi:hypothetical protein